MSQNVSPQESNQLLNELNALKASYKRESNWLLIWIFAFLGSLILANRIHDVLWILVIFTGCLFIRQMVAVNRCERAIKAEINHLYQLGIIKTKVD